MNIAIIGYGKMGKIIEIIALKRHHKIVLKVTSKDKLDATVLKNSNADVAIEFTQPTAVVKNILTCFEANIPIVVGTTGWNEQFQHISNICKEKNQTLLYASNFSIGVNLFFKLNDYFAQLMKKFNEYDVQMTEVHHTAKKDAPSGTAVTIAEQILKHYPQKHSWSLNQDDNTLYINAHRVGDEKGFHAVHYLSEIDELQISHHAYSRNGFALGAVLAAEYIKDKKGVISFNEVLSL